MLTLRSLLFYLGQSASLLLVLLFYPLALTLPQPRRNRFLALWARFNLWWLGVTCGLRYEVDGLEHLPTEGAAILLSKHQSAWETIAFQVIFPAQTWVLKRELLKIPIFGWGLAIASAVAIDRKAGKRALREVVEQGTDRLQRGLWVVVFPEGTRMAPGEHGTYNIGGAMLASKSGYPVVPVAHNAGEFWRRNSMLKHPGTVHVSIGPLVSTEGRKPGEINAEVEAWIEGRMLQITTLPTPEEV